MRRLNFWFITFLLVLLVSCNNNKQDDPTMRAMIERLIPEQASQFHFEKLENTDNDCFELESEGNKIIIRGNNANSMAVGLNHYLKYYCLTTVSWYLNDPVEMPEVLPKIDEKVRIDASAKNRFFLNYCTFGYSMPWWKWNDWERFIDWMALNGVNMPLATTGQEAIWYRVWTKMGLTDEEIRNYFTGPAHLPWHRMINLDYWQGALPKEWLDNQEELQKKIVAREREFNMKPILPAFAGHVPKELNRVYPEAKITRMMEWGGFEDKYRASFLSPTDPLFDKIQKEFLTQQTELFGTDNIYGIDPFNEVDPPSWDADSLASYSKHLYESVTAVDPEATWLQMAWLFYADTKNWTQPRIEAYLKAVPQDKLLMLDYFCEFTQIYKQTNSFYGQPYLWCYLGNFGGNTMISGNMKTVSERIDSVYNKGDKNLWGIGSTLEALDINPFMYEYVLEKAWNHKISDNEWFERLADRRIGKTDNAARVAWQILLDKVLVQPAAVGQGTLTNARPCLTGNSNWTTKPLIEYNNKDLLLAWEQMLKIQNCSRDTYIFDIVNVGRQVLGNYFHPLRDNFTKAYEAKDVAKMKKIGLEMEAVLADMETLLACHPTFSLHNWLSDARDFGHDDASKKYYEENARNLLSTWGNKAQSLNDYANRSWSGLTSSYYTPRWEMFIDDVIKATEEKKAFDEKAYLNKITEFEYNWYKSTDAIPATPKGDAVKISRELLDKYKKSINEI